MAELDNKRIAKNAVALTIRMILVTVVGLYTSRIVLQALGVEDYGIYGVVGGVIGMAGFLNAAMSGATSRFITFELGKSNDSKLKLVFSTALIIHFIISLIVIILGETVGLWFLNNKMVFPEDRLFAANVIYQLSVFSVIVGCTQVPYSACIIAHERMSIYSYFEIINVILKLVIVYCLLLYPYDRLILYVSLLFIVSILKAIFYRVYCLRHFKESKFSACFDRNIAKEMLVFSSVDLYGNACFVAKRQGEPVILNMFFGVIPNAASSIAATVAGSISALTLTVYQAFRPQIIKQYAANNITGMSLIMRRSVQFTLLAFAIVAIPFIVETDRILYLWLGTVPKYSVPFFRLIIVASLFDIVIMVNNAAAHATGNIQGISFINGSIYLLCPVVSYVLLKYASTNIYTIYIVDIFLLMFVIAFGFIFVKKLIRTYPIKNYIFSILKSLFVVFISLLSVWFIARYYISDFEIYNSTNVVSSLSICAFTLFLSAIILLPLSYALAFNVEERIVIKMKIKELTSKFLRRKS